MTSKLCEMLKEEFPSEAENSASSISMYGADERIYLSLFHRSFCGKDKKLITHEEIDRIARKFFILFYEIRKVERDDSMIILNPHEDMDYLEYHGHLITIFSPFVYPRMDISTGNRGNTVLEEVQRQRYFGFVKDIYEKFLENARI